MNQSFSIAIVIAALTFAPVPVASASQDDVAVRMATSPSGIEYATGGIGQNSVDRIGELARTGHYNVKLTFAWNKGNFVAGVPVTIHDQNGKKIFDMARSDSLLILHLKEGRYKAVAMYDGKVEERSFDAPATGLAVAHFSWRQPQGSHGIAAR